MYGLKIHEISSKRKKTECMRRKKISIKKIYELFKKYGDLDITVNTPYGYKKINGCDITARNSTVMKITTDNNLYLYCSPNHKVKVKNGIFKEVIELLPNDIIETEKGNSKVKSIELLPYKKDLYDIDVAEVKQYYSNGIVSHNSSLFSALSYCLFDKCERAYKGYDVLNNKSDTFHCKFNFTINNKDFFIEKTGIKKFNKQTGKNTVKVNIDFWTIDDNGNIVSLNGENRDETNAIIRTYIGTYDDFIMTALSIQNKYSGFVEMGQSERKDLLVKFLDLEIFDFLYKKASDEIKDITGALKEYRKKDFPKLLNEADSDYVKYNSEYTKYFQEKNSLLHQKEELQNSLLLWTKKLYDVDKNVIDIKILLKQQEELNEKIERLVLEIKECKNDIINCDDYLNNKDIIQYLKNNKNIENLYTEYQQKLIDKKNIQNNIELLKVEVSGKLSKLKHLEQHEYDPNCPFCMNNIFVKDAIKTREELNKDIERSNNELNNLKNIEKEISNFNDIETKYNEYMNVLSQIENIKSKRIKLENKMLVYENDSIKLQNEQNIINENRKKYEKNVNNLKHNEKIQKNIDEITSQLSIVNNKFIIVDEKTNYNYTQMKIAQNNKLKITEEIQRLEQLELDSEAYQYYLEAVDTNGIPYNLIAQVIPTIEEEINNILMQIVDFQLNLELDGKNINTKIIMGDDNQWSLELGGGMERFIVSIALRTALINISNLPRPPFLIIDEGFGNIDSDIISQIPLLFDYLKTQFKFLICISHSHIIKDMVDNIINVNKINDFSSIQYK